MIHDYRRHRYPFFSNLFLFFIFSNLALCSQPGYQCHSIWIFESTKKSQHLAARLCSYLLICQQFSSELVAMFCILAPEMALGEPMPAPRRWELPFNKPKSETKRMRSRLPPRPSGVKHLTLGSVFSGFNYHSVKSSIAKPASVKITRRERKMMRAQDIFVDDCDR